MLPDLGTVTERRYASLERRAAANCSRHHARQGSAAEFRKSQDDHRTRDQGTRRRNLAHYSRRGTARTRLQLSSWHADRRRQDRSGDSPNFRTRTESNSPKNATLRSCTSAKKATRSPTKALTQSSRRISTSIFAAAQVFARHGLRTWVNDPAVVLLFEGNAIAAQHPALQVTLINSQNESVTLYFDADTHLPIKKSFEWRDPVDKQKNLEEEVYENYRQVSGIMAPYNVTRLFNGDMSNQRFLNSVTINQGLDPAMFDPNSGYNPNKARQIRQALRGLENVLMFPLRIRLADHVELIRLTTSRIVCNNLTLSLPGAENA